MARDRETPWARVRRELRQKPIVEGRIGGAARLYAERYIYQAIEATVSGLACAGLVTQFGGGRVSESDGAAAPPGGAHAIAADPPGGGNALAISRERSTLPSSTFSKATRGSPRDLDTLARSFAEPQMFSDALVGAAARQLTDELQKGPAADEGFIERLAAIMLEQAFRALTTPASGGINPRHVHYSRLQAVLNHIHSRLADDLSAAALAARAGVSPGYFRRVFLDATGMPPHRYVLAARLEHARKLLGLSEMPIPQIAQDCGFASQSHLTARFREAHAITPAQFRAHFRQRNANQSNTSR